jgi:hypothetical protein
MVYKHRELYSTRNGVNTRCDKNKPIRLSARGIVEEIGKENENEIVQVTNENADRCVWCLLLLTHAFLCSIEKEYLIFK